jgi:hypothetical protein
MAGLYLVVGISIIGIGAVSAYLLGILLLVLL